MACDHRGVPPTLNQTNLVVEDMAATAAFYRRLGADFGDSPAVHAEARYPGISLELDDAESARWWHAGWRADQRSRPVLTFEVDSDEEVQALYAELTGAGARAVQPPHLAFFGAWYAIVEDPDGNEVALFGPRDRSRGAQGWPPAAESPNP